MACLSILSYLFWQAAQSQSQGITNRPLPEDTWVQSGLEWISSQPQLKILNQF